MASTFSKRASFQAVPIDELVEADDVQLKSVAHTVLESKLEKMLSTARSPEELSKTKQLALEWMKKWDLDGDGVLSSLEIKGAAMEHVKLRKDYRTRGIWMVVLLLLIFCCGGVILGVSIWANAISKDSEVESSEDLGGFSMRKKDGSAVVKTATALYEFTLPRIGYLPFDELSTVRSISFLYQRTLRQMSVSGFRWHGTHNITFFSPRRDRFTVTWLSDTHLSITFQAGGIGEPGVVYEGVDTDRNLEASIIAVVGALKQQGVPVTTMSVWRMLSAVAYQLATVIPEECVPGLMDFYLRDNLTALQGPCAVAVTMGIQGFGVVEAAVGPQDYYGTKMTEQESEELSGYTADIPASVRRGLFIPDPVERRERYLKFISQWIERNA
eukprot:jgi/Mesvir1/17446/Mv08722-RA.1